MILNFYRYCISPISGNHKIKKKDKKQQIRIKWKMFDMREILNTGKTARMRKKSELFIDRYYVDYLSVPIVKILGQIIFKIR